MKRIFTAIVAMMMAMCILTGCSEADKVNWNISRDAEYFNCERRITVYNARTDTIILEMEGYMNISNDSDGELVCTVKTGKDEYKKNYIYLNEYILYVVEDITGTDEDPYHFKINFHTEFPVSVDVKP
jgi:hypothetical protein